METLHCNNSHTSVVVPKAYSEMPKQLQSIQKVEYHDSQHIELTHYHCLSY